MRNAHLFPAQSLDVSSTRKSGFCAPTGVQEGTDSQDANQMRTHESERARFQDGPAFTASAVSFWQPGALSNQGRDSSVSISDPPLLDRADFVKRVLENLKFDRKVHGRVCVPHISNLLYILGRPGHPYI